MPLTKIKSLGITDGTIALADLSTTGTPSSATFLRGDNSWAAALSAGQVIQVVTATDSTVRSTTSTSFVTGSNTLSASITPSSTSNKIFIIVNTAGRQNTDGRYAIYTVYRGATNLGTSDGLLWLVPSGNRSCSVAMSYLDNPNSTSSLTYQVYFKTNVSDSTVYLQDIASLSGTGNLGSITLLEIKG